MASADMQDLVERFDEFYRAYYEDDIADLAQHYPGEQRSLYIDWSDLYRFDEDLAEDVRNQPDQLRTYAEEALRLYDLPVDVSLGQAHVRVRGLPETTDIRNIRAEHVNRLESVRGIIRKATGVKPKVRVAAFECQRCGTLTRIPQEGGSFQEPHECQGCERQGPFRINFDQSEFIDAQKLRVQESPEGLRGGETPENIDVHIEDDITGHVSPGDSVRCTGVLRMEQQSQGGEPSALFDVFMEGVAVEPEEEQFDEMDIDEEDEREILELSEQDDVYERMVDSIAPSIYGHEKAKLAMILQLFSGVTKNLPDGSRTRGDMHLLMIGDPGTGKCLSAGTAILQSDGTTCPIGDLVEKELTNPTPVDDGVFDEASFAVPSVTNDGTIEHRDVTRVWKRESPDHLYRIKTQRGREITATPSHPLFVLDDGQLSPRTAAELDDGEFLSVPRRIEPLTGDGTDPFQREPPRTNADDDTVPNVSDLLTDVRTTLRLDQSDCRVRRTTYQHYERGDRNPTRNALRTVVSAFEDRIAQLEDEDHWRRGDVESESGSSRRAMSDGGDVCDAKGTFTDEPNESKTVEDSVARLRQLVESDIGWDRIESIQVIEPEGEWVYDLEVEDTHNYIAEGLVSHNSALLQYVRNIAPRSVYTSGKGSSAAGLCVTGDTQIQTSTGARAIEDIVGDVIPTPVDIEIGVGHEIALPTFDPDTGEIVSTRTSHVWRMPEKPCREILTADGSRVEASRNTPILTDEQQDDSWKPIGEIEVGDRVGTPIAHDGWDPPYSGDMISDGGLRGDAAAQDTMSGLRWVEVVDAADTGSKEVFDLTVPGTHNFVANGIITHNTAAAVRDDFGDGQQWSLEAGALVLADQGVAAVDEIDKMESSDRSALHEGLEAQEISISKAGINATLKARCSLLAAANPQYGRFDPYEPMGEQIDLEPALISRFDLIFTMTDQPDEENDRNLADHILETNYAGELHTQRRELTAPGISDDELDDASGTVTPSIDPDLFRKYVAFAQQSCYPRMSAEARESIQEFYVDLRSRGTDEDAPVPVTARKLEALVRLSEASARIRLSDTVEYQDADRAIELVRSCLQDIGVDPETGQYDADVIETGRSKTQRERVRNIKGIIRELQDEHEEGAPLDAVLSEAGDAGIEREKAEHQIQKLKDTGDVYTPQDGILRIV